MAYIYAIRMTARCLGRGTIGMYIMYLEVIEYPACPIVAYAEKKVVLWNQRKPSNGKAVEMAPSPPQGYLVVCQPARDTDNRLLLHYLDRSGQISSDLICMICMLYLTLLSGSRIA